MRLRSLVILAVLVALASSALCSLRQRYADEDEIREAVYRHLMYDNGSANFGSIAVYYLAIDRGWSIWKHKWPWLNPSSGVLSKFSGHGPQVEPVSTCLAWDDNDFPDRLSAEHSLILHTGRAKWISSTTVEVDGGYFEGRVSAWDCVYTVALRNGAWVVTRRRITGVS